MDDLQDELKQFGKEIAERNDDLRALAEVWKEVKAQEMPHTIAEAMKLGWKLSTQPLFADMLDYPEEDRAKDRTRVVQMKWVKEALVRQLEAAAKTHVVGWMDVIEEFVRELLKELKSLALKPLELIGDITLIVTHIHKAMVAFIKAQLKYASVANVLKDAEKMASEMDRSIAFVRRKALPQRSGGRTRKKVLSRT